MNNIFKRHRHSKLNSSNSNSNSNSNKNNKENQISILKNKATTIKEHYKSKYSKSSSNGVRSRVSSNNNLILMNFQDLKYRK